MWLDSVLNLQLGEISTAEAGVLLMQFMGETVEGGVDAVSTF